MLERIKFVLGFIEHSMLRHKDNKCSECSYDKDTDSFNIKNECKDNKSIEFLYNELSNPDDINLDNYEVGYPVYGKKKFKLRYEDFVVVEKRCIVEYNTINGER